MESHRLRVARTARVVTLGEPRAASEIWFLLHGHAQLASAMLESCRALASPSRLLVAPEALSRFYLKNGSGPIGASWMTRDERDAEIADYVAYLDDVARWCGESLGCTARARTVLGFSQGAATAWRWALLGSTPLTRVIAWGGGIPTDLDLAARGPKLATLRIDIVRGKRDPLQTVESLRADRARLDDTGHAHHALEFDGSHRIDDRTLELLAGRV